MPKGRPVCPYREAARRAKTPRYADAIGVERWTSSGNGTEAKRKWQTAKRRANGVQPPKPKAPPQIIAKKNRENVKRWRKENPQGRASQQRTFRARRKGSHGRHNRHHVELLLTKQDAQCFYCAGPMEPVTWDHFIPMVRGGENNVDNGRLACHPCNTLKNDMLPRDFFVKMWAAL
jgi:5-methylcytosine-specific restriction endonuclease McrA